MAHDRSPPPGYLEERGVNVRVYGSAGTAREAIERAAYAVLVGEDLWMPFDSPDHGWVVSRFGAGVLVQRNGAGTPRMIRRRAE